MSALDDAVAAHMAHAAGAMGDPLTDSLAEQQACNQPGQLTGVQPHPAIAEADECTALPRWFSVLAAVVLCAVLVLSHFYPWGTAPAMP